MSTYNLQIDHHSKNKFLNDLVFVGNQIYNGLVNLGKTTAGFIILIPLSLALAVVLPITYILISLILSYFLINLTFLSSKALKIVVNKENYTDIYNFYLFTNKCLFDFVRIESKSKAGGKGILLTPVIFFIKRYHSRILKINHYLESQLFEKHNYLEIPLEDVELLRAQLKDVDHDWYDDELWKDFQTEHHHLVKP